MVDVQDVSLRGTYWLRTICEVLREIYDLAQTDAPESREIRARLIEVERMAKRMSRALYEYNKRYDADWWEKNPDVEQDLLRDLNRTFLPPE